MFLKALPFVVAYMIIGATLKEIDPWAEGLFNFFMALFVIPMLSINFMNKETVGSYFEFKILKSVFDNLGDYIVAALRDILLGIIFLIMWIVLIGIPAGSFTKNIFIADFYRRKVR